MKKSEKIKQDILKQIEYYYLATQKEKKENSKIQYAGRVYDEKELINLIDSSLEFYLTYGRYSKEFEKKLCDYLKVKYSLFVNSGSSASLLSFMALTSPLLKDRKINRGDEIITTACCFPTTIAPIIQYGAVPIFVDIELETCNIDVTKLNNALSKKTKAVFVANTLGNPVNIDKIKKFCNKNNIWFILDSCDSLGSKYKNKYLEQYADISTNSFYPAHFITTGQGGAVYTNNSTLYSIMRSIRDWGRQYNCNDCKKCRNRFNRSIKDYDCKYIYNHFGYNLKATDMQAAIGCAQMDKLNNFIQKRKENWNRLYRGLKHLDNCFIFQKAEKNSDSCWFVFLITLKENLSFKRVDLTKYLEKYNIETRSLFAGNIIKHPCFDNLKLNKDYRIIDDLKNTNIIFNNSFFIGVYPGLTIYQIDFMIKKINDFFKEKTIL